MDVKKIRKDFPILARTVNNKPLIYFDNSATTQKPKIVIETLNKFFETHNANIHRGIHKLAEESTLLYEEAHKKVSDFINAEFEEVIFTKNTTESLNLLAYSLFNNLKENDEIIVSQMEHHSNFVPWQQLAKSKNFKLNFVKIDKEGNLDLDHLKQLLNKKTKIVSLVHISNVLGTINPVKEIAKIVHENNSLLIVDAAQSVPHMKIDVKELTKLVRLKINGFVVEGTDNTLEFTQKGKPEEIKLLYDLKEKIRVIKIKGIKGINQVLPVKRDDEYIVLTSGTNLKEILELPEVDLPRTTTNDIHEIFVFFRIAREGNIAIDKNINRDQ